MKILKTALATMLVASTLLIPVDSASAGESLQRICTSPSSGNKLTFSPIPGSDRISMSSSMTGKRFVLKPLGGGSYKMIDRGRLVHFGSHSVTITFLRKNKQGASFSC